VTADLLELAERLPVGSVVSRRGPRLLLRRVGPLVAPSRGPHGRER
jgi:hypothetical protein